MKFTFAILASAVSAAGMEVFDKMSNGGVTAYTDIDYDTKVVARSQDKLLAKKRQFFTLVDPSHENAALARNLHIMKMHYKDDMDIWVYDNSEELMSFTYECYQPPCSYYIEPLEGRSYAYISTAHGKELTKG